MTPQANVLVALLVSLVGCERSVAPLAPPVPQPVTPALVASLVAVPAPSQKPEPTWSLPPNWPYQVPVVVKGTRAMVVTDNALASQAGRDVLMAGGNAADAAVATAFALAAAYPTAGNIGGGGFAVALVNGQPSALDFRETAPLAAKRDMYVDSMGKTTDDARLGIRASGVPGSVAGLWELYERLGSKRITWAELLAPAIELTERGFVVDEAFRQTIADHVDRLRKYPTSATLFLPQGEPPPIGSTWKNPELARALKRIREKGPEGFYQGETANALVAQMKRDHGLITQADLRRYRAKWRQPLEFAYRGVKITAMPPPSSGGVTLAMICHILDGIELKQFGFQTPAALHTIFEAMRRSFAARNAKLGDPDFVKMPLDELLGTAWANEQRATILPDRATPSTEIESAGTPSGNGPHTTHFSVVNADGNAVALTTTLNWWYGSGVTVKGAGFVLNNEMDDFAAVPGTPNGFGLVQGEANAIMAGKRMLSSMSPTIVTGPDGKVMLVAGAAGGPTIITTVFEELSNVLDFGLDPGKAVSVPRFHMQHLPDVVTAEQHGIADETQKRLEAMGYAFKERGHIADAPLIARVGAEWLGIAEPRRPGALAAAP